MKRNLISVIILALCLANFVLTALMLFTVMPEAKKANALIDEISAAIKIDLQSGAGNGSTYPIDKMEEFKVNSGEQLTVNFKKGSDGVDHYCLIKLTLMVNKESDKYEAMITNGGLAAKESIITNAAFDVIGSKTIDEFKEDEAGVMDEILVELQGYFGADFVVDINKEVLTQ